MAETFDFLWSGSGGQSAGESRFSVFFGIMQGFLDNVGKIKTWQDVVDAGKDLVDDMGTNPQTPLEKNLQEVGVVVTHCGSKVLVLMVYYPRDREGGMGRAVLKDLYLSHPRGHLERQLERVEHVEVQHCRRLPLLLAGLSHDHGSSLGYF